MLGNLAFENPFSFSLQFFEVDNLLPGKLPAIAAPGQALESLPGEAGGLPLFSYFN